MSGLEHQEVDPGLFVRSRQAGAGEADHAGARNMEPVARPAAIAIAALFAIAGGGWYLVDASRTTILALKAPQAAHLSIVVLPFANLSGDPAQDYFADGITENLTTELSRIKGSDPSRWRRAYRRRSEGRFCARPVSSSDLLDGLSFSRELPGVGRGSLREPI